MNKMIKNLSNKRGFTLMELLVYMVIVGIVVVIAGQVYSDSTKMRVRTQSMISANQVAENVGNLLRDDIAQMGAKSAVDLAGATTGSDAFIFKPDVYMNVGSGVTNPDSSSFNYTKNKFGTGLDSLTYRTILYTDAGTYVRTEEISWYAMANGILFRTCQTISGTENAEECPSENPAVVQIAEGVHEFSVTPAKPGVVGTTNLLFPYYPENLSKKSFRFVSYYGVNNFQRVITTPAAGGESISLSGLVSNYSEDGSPVADPVKHQIFVAESGSSVDGWLQCKKMTIQPDSTYEISFNMLNIEDETRMFQPGLDHFAVGIRKAGETQPEVVPEIPDFMFYPPQADGGMGTRYMKFRAHVAEAFDACVAFTFVLTSPTVALGSFTISDFKMQRVGDFDYEFDESFTPQIVDKKNVRAMQVKVDVRKNGEAGVNTVVIPVPSNGVRG